MQSSRQPSLVRAENFTSKGNNAYAAEKRRADFERKVINPMQQVVWNVESSSLRKPTWKILESTHAVIMNTDVSIIVDRIVKINKELSLMAEYDSKKASVFLRSIEGLEIVVKLYTTGKKSVRPAIVVEVQRYSGCTVAFRKYCDPILAAAKGKPNFSQMLKAVRHEPALPQYKRSLTDSQESSLDGVEMAKSLLEQDLYDSQYLGLQSLENMTNSARSSITATLTASRAVLCVSTNERDEGIQQAVCKILTNGGPPKKRMRLCEGETSIRKSHVSVLHNKALSLLFNALSALGKQVETEELHQIYENLNERNIVERLWEILGYSEQSPHEALLAAKCLLVLLTVYSTAQSHVDKRDLLHDAYSVGLSSHSALLRECKGLLEIL